MHVLEDLPPEAWVLGDRADTVMPPAKGIMLSHEGLARLARHVVKNYVDRAPAETDLTFDWRASLPGKIQMRLAPQYWVWQAEGFDHKSVSRYFSGFVGHLVDTLAERTEGVTNMQAVLERIEQQLPGIADGPDKALMLAIYALWHSVLAPSEHRPQAAKFLAKHISSSDSKRLHLASGFSSPARSTTHPRRPAPCNSSRLRDLGRLGGPTIPAEPVAIDPPKHPRSPVQ